MSDEDIHVPYNRDLAALEKLLSTVRRPGDFFAEASFETALPRLEIEGVGTLSFPVPGSQVRQIIDHASRAPFGRGERTILDQSVRKVWQVPPDKVRLSGRSWDRTFSQILATVADGLGCAEAKVSAELYKLLVYDEGGFFKAHRDTEKTAGMFGTLIVVLPCAHTGGELVIRHAGREVSLDLSGAEVSELRVAAFYADCEHEVRPVTGGYRVCLVYNLVQPRAGKGSRQLTAPTSHGQIEAAAGTLREAFAGRGAPAKLAWLFRHEYSPAGLSFAGLKGEDATLAKALRRAAEAADCAVHLGIVHIEETGPAEPDYSDYDGGWYDEGPDEDADFAAVEVSDSRWHVGEWHDTDDHPVDFGQLPLAEGEVLPAGALDGEKPDEQRLMEATGNEGASFERSYHRAALVLWPRERFADVLMQAGVGAVLPYFAEQVSAASGAETTPAARRRVINLARRIVKTWEGPRTQDFIPEREKKPDRGEMLDLLVRLGDAGVLENFVSGVVTREFDGTEDGALVPAAVLLGPSVSGRLFTVLARERIFRCPGAVALLLSGLLAEIGPDLGTLWKKALTKMAVAIVAALPDLKPPPKPARPDFAFRRWTQDFRPPNQKTDEEQPVRSARAVDVDFVTDLLDSLRALGAAGLRADAASAIAGNTAVFDPVAVVVPALATLHVREGAVFAKDADCARLWRHAAEFLLKRSEQPPTPPADWRQKANIRCACADCRELAAFVRDPATREHRFPIKKERRRHLHEAIERLGLDLTHETERRGSPQVLVCTKTLRTFERQCEQHRSDVAAMTALLALPHKTSRETAGLTARLDATRQRQPPKAKLR